MARQAQNGFSKFDITKSKAMRNIEDIYDSESSAAEEPEKTETQTVDLESTEENAPAAKQEPAEETPAEQTPAEKKPAEEIAPVPSDSIAGPSSSLNSGMPSGMKPLKAEKGVKISLPMKYYFKLVQIKACTGKSLQDLAAQGVMEFIDRFSQPDSQVNEKSD
nr:MAG TPA: hypothetical protein [Caudoviricetes sp.]